MTRCSVRETAARKAQHERAEKEVAGIAKGFSTHDSLYSKLGKDVTMAQKDATLLAEVGERLTVFISRSISRLVIISSIIGMVIWRISIKYHSRT